MLLLKTLTDANKLLAYTSAPISSCKLNSGTKFRLPKYMICAPGSSPLAANSVILGALYPFAILAFRLMFLLILKVVPRLNEVPLNVLSKAGNCKLAPAVAEDKTLLLNIVVLSVTV